MTSSSDSPTDLLSLCLFGSASRGDADELSDFDVLAVVEDGSGRQHEKWIAALVREQYGMNASISFYGESRLRKMFLSGHLFAWHLFTESKPVLDFPSAQEVFGRPSEYNDGQSDVADLITLLESVPQSTRKSPNNAIYEYGIVYVCLRNIAISASYHLGPKLDFSRYAPYLLGDASLPLARGCYERAFQCRASGQRGCAPPVGVTLKEVVDAYSIGHLWSTDIMRRICHAPG
jgi:hypothetical protein